MISTMLDEILAAVVTALGDDAPARQTVEHGDLADYAHDCEQVLVSLVSYALEPQADEGGCAVIPVATFAAHFLLCYPYGTPEVPAPSVDEISEAAKRIADAGVRVAEGLHDEREAGTLFSGRCCDDVTITAPAPIGPDGALAGWGYTLTVRL